MQSSKSSTSGIHCSNQLHTHRLDTCAAEYWQLVRHSGYPLLDTACVHNWPLRCRERAAGLFGTPAYFTAMALFDLVPMRVVPPCFFAVSTYWMIGFRPGVPYLPSFWLTLVLSNMVSTWLR